MARNTNTIKKTTHKPDFNPGPFVAEVVSHLDGDRMGTLKVQILSGSAGDGYQDKSGFSYVDYCPPFFGNTPYAATGASAGDASNTQGSYGFWMVPPDIGTKVLVLFVESDDNRGYWIGCIPETYINHMVPGIASNPSVELTPQAQTKLGYNKDQGVPVAEINKRLTDKTGTIETDRIKKPMHPFALRLAEQGLLKDPIRGTTTSSARRSAISNVYGISTPGPNVLNMGNTYNMGSRANPTKVYKQREGGTQFVMDDGDVWEDDKTGKRGITNELVRLRTRTGHQILMHNSSDLIYICNSKGTAWIEFTSDGKIDVFAQDSVSIHSENDFNFRADRDVNIEAGRNINLSSLNSLHLEAGSWIEGIATTEVNWTAGKHVNIQSNGKVRISSDINPTNPLVTGIEIFSTTGGIDMYATQQIKMQSIEGMSISAAAEITVQAGASTTISTVGELTLTTKGSTFIDSTLGNTFTTKGLHTERASLIDMNGPTTAPAPTVSDVNLAKAIKELIDKPEYATTVTFLTTYELPYRERDQNATAGMQKGWEGNNYYRQKNITSISKRVPTHEPWDHHENTNPEEFKPLQTDRGG